MRTAQIPKTRIARDKILSWIREGKLSEGDRLPPERELAKILKMNHQTIRKSLAELEQEGLIIRKHRIGSFLREVPPIELTKGIALVLPKYMIESKQIPQHPLTNLYIRGLLEGVDQRKYSISILSYRPDRLWVDVGEILRVRRIEGILLHPITDIDVKDIKRILGNGIKIVLLHQEPKLLSLNLPYLSVDEQVPMVQILERFVELGHRNIVVCLYQISSQGIVQRETLRTFIKKYNLAPFEDMIVEIPNKSGYVDFSVIESIFERSTLPTAILVHDEFCASYVFRCCYKRRIKIPEDISLAALVDNAPNFHPIGLSAPDTIASNIELVKRAADVIMKLVEGKDVAEREVKLKCNVVWKESVGKCRKSSL